MKIWYLNIDLLNQEEWFCGAIHIEPIKLLKKYKDIASALNKISFF